MRSASVLGFIGLFLSSIVGACVGPPPPGHCAGAECMCLDGSDCILDCPAAGCQTTCANISNCDAQCGDACVLECRDTSNCDLECGDGCVAVCESVSNCDLECGADCAVECTDLSNCDVVMISGEVVCSGVGNCNVRCAFPDGDTAPADDCGGGRFRCPAGAC